MRQNQNKLYPGTGQYDQVENGRQSWTRRAERLATGILATVCVLCLFFAFICTLLGVVLGIRVAWQAFCNANHILDWAVPAALFAATAGPDRYQKQMEDLLNAGVKKIVWQTVIGPDGTKTRVPIYREEKRYNPQAGAVETFKELMEVRDALGNKLSARDISLFCPHCKFPLASQSVVECCKCGEELGKCCARQAFWNDSSWYCPTCVRQAWIRRFLAWLVSPFVIWEYAS